MHEPFVFCECSCCGQYHKEEFAGDCRDDSQRFTYDELMKDIDGGTPIEIVVLN